MEEERKEMSFLEHLEALRWHLMRSSIAVMICAGVLFYNYRFVFDTVIFGPVQPSFLTYKALCKLSHLLEMGDALCINAISFELVNLELSGQFTMHIWVSFVGGLVLGSPYILWELWRFVRPALTEKEKRYTHGIVFFASMLFIIGVLFSYYVIVPMTVNFLGNYQITSLVKNTISMSSYISTLTILSLIMGIVFEMPMIIYFFTKIGLLSSAFMRKNRKMALVIILLVAAIITPTSDIPTLVLVSAPLYILYEASIFVSKYVEKGQI